MFLLSVGVQLIVCLTWARTFYRFKSLAAASTILVSLSSLLLLWPMNVLVYQLATC